MFLSSSIQKFNHFLNQFQMSINNLIANQQLTASPAPAPQSFPNLLIERLYYAEGRHHPAHPRHGSFSGLYLN